jgi:hypothetical protein
MLAHVSILTPFPVVANVGVVLQFGARRTTTRQQGLPPAQALLREQRFSQRAAWHQEQAG